MFQADREAVCLDLPSERQAMMASKRVAEGLFGRVQWRDSPRHGLWRETRRSANSSWPCPHRKPQHEEPYRLIGSASMVTKRTGFIGEGSRTRAPHGKVSHRQPTVDFSSTVQRISPSCGASLPTKQKPTGRLLGACSGRRPMGYRFSLLTLLFSGVCATIKRQNSIKFRLIL